MANTYFEERDVFNIYKQSYGIKVSFQQVLDAELAAWLELHEKATNCAKMLVLPSLISLIAALCGLKTAVSSGSFTTSLNQYLIAVCDPGGGKSHTYSRIMEPVLQLLKNKHGLQLQLETYTCSGIQKHQNDNGGYGLITTDEGHRFLAGVNAKQSRGESEKAFLCKMWGGKGDTNHLAGGVRGFERTSMSTAIYIQPGPFLHEISGLNGNDGLMDRFLIMSAKPTFHKTSTLRENMRRLQESPLQDFNSVMEAIYLEHKAGHSYILSDEAQAAYDEMVDGYAEFIREKYGSDDDENKDNEPEFSQKEDNGQSASVISSKDTQHILRLSAILHVLHQHVSRVMGLHDEPTLEIPLKRIQQAKCLYFTIIQQKAVFMQASTVDASKKLKLNAVTTLRDRVTKAVCHSHGPVVTVRALRRHIKGALSENLKVELEVLARNGFGRVQDIRNHGTSTVFFKIPGSLIDVEIGPHSGYLQMAGMDIQRYDAYFRDTSKLTEELHRTCEQFHPQLELLQAELII